MSGGSYGLRVRVVLCVGGVLPCGADGQCV